MKNVFTHLGPFRLKFDAHLRILQRTLIVAQLHEACRAVRVDGVLVVNVLAERLGVEVERILEVFANEGFVSLFLG